ncbi:MAG TPA: amino acid adenylation domain-containing protein, partial [Pyrinomonadaceae bacterium]|nr:amino acid adenylation domain-containing protein [Pyrinomonadaceae bacterium]
EELQPERSLSHQPLFQVMFALQNAPQERLELAGLELGAWGGAGGAAAKFDLLLSVTEAGGRLAASLEYSTDLFDAQTVERMQQHFERLLRGVAEDAGRRVSDIGLLSTEEERRIIVEWNETAREYPRRSLGELLEAQVGRTPEAVALVCGDERLTYADLNRRANQLAHRLQRSGVGPEARVAIFCERSPEMVVALLGVLKAGAAYVPLDPDYPQERLAYMMDDAGMALVLTQERLRGRMPEGAWPVLSLDGEREELALERVDNPGSLLDPDHLAYVIYTSGSTGKPKGAMNTHRGIVNRLLWMQDAYHLTPDDVVMQKTPFSFDVSVWEFFWPLLTGARLVLAEPGGHQDPSYLARLIEQQGVTTMHFVPSMLQAFLPEADPVRCASLSRVICSGEALSRELQERFQERLGAELHNLYGPTEAAVDVTYWACERGDERRTVPIGRPISNTGIFILDRQLRPVPVGVAGELFIGGEGLARGYHGRAGLTAEKFVPDPFSREPGARLYRTGDLAYFRPGGEVEFLGRLDFQVKVRGFRIELGEVEAALVACEGVRQAVVVAREDSPGAKRLVGYVVGAGEGDLVGSELRGRLRRRLPEYMVPEAVIVLAELPLTANGKLNRRALPVPERESMGLVTTFVEPRTPLEELMCAIWREVLNLEAVGIEDNFFDIGGNSLSTTRVVSKVREELEMEIPLRWLFEYPTVAALTATMEEHAS